VIRLAELDIRLVLLDIEGTTTPIAYVHEVLFSYARQHLPAYLERRRQTPEVPEAARLRRPEPPADLAGGEPPPPLSGAEGDLAPYALWLMDRDRKSPGLKRLQGHVWEEGYQAGTLRGQVYDDVPGAITRWRAAGIEVAIYSSGSALAQRRLFESVPDGDLTPHLRGFFDTAVGAKRDPASYASIAQATARRPGQLLFVSDVAAELDAARTAGCRTALCVRPGNAPQDPGGHPVVRTFDEIA
jgi:enolase-phosphatase E1